jgi:hypothetical protein
MALIPGTLPSDTCYGTPQDLLELFAQYLDVPAFALNSKVVFSSANPATLTADVIWFDTGFAAPASATNPIMKITVSGGFVDYVNNYATNLAVVTTPAAGDYVMISQTSVLKKITYANLVPTVTPVTNKAFFFAKSTSQTVTTATETKCTFDTAVFNQSSIITLASSTFTPTVSGYYHIEGHLYAPAGGSGYTTKLVLRKNGTSVLLGVYSSSGANTDVPSATIVSGVLFFNGTSDNFELYGKSEYTIWAPGGPSTNAIYFTDSPTYGTYICGFYLGA